jgi:hypothetical protein
MSKKLANFLDTYDIKVLDTNKRCLSLNHDFFNHSTDKNLVDRGAPIAEPLYTLAVPLSVLEALVDLDERFFQGVNSSGSRFLFRGILAREEEESFLRHTNAAVKEAYEHYSLLLNLAKNGNH